MAKYDTLPIYKAVYDFLLKILKFIAQFPREYKYTIGDKIQGAAVAIVIDIYRANQTKEKIPHLKSLLENVQLVHLYLNIAYDYGIFPKKDIDAIKAMVEDKDIDAIKAMVEDISNQAQGWLKTQEKVREPVKS